MSSHQRLKPLPKLGTAADDFDSWALTAGILLNKVFFSVTKGPDYDFKLYSFSKEL